MFFIFARVTGLEILFESCRHTPNHPRLVFMFYSKWTRRGVLDVGCLQNSYGLEGEFIYY